METIDFKRIGSTLKERRKELGFTQAEVARLLAISQVSYSDYENGKNRIPLEALVQLRKKFDLNLSELIEGTSTPIKASHLFNPTSLACVGLCSKEYKLTHSTLFSDNFIRAELGLEQIVNPKTPIDSILSLIQPKERRPFIVNLLAHLNTLIHLDGDLDISEIDFFSRIKSSQNYTFNKIEHRKISSAEKKKYFSDASSNYLRSYAVRRFIIWILLLAATSDGKIGVAEEEYIFEVGQILKIARNDISDIKRLIIEDLGRDITAPSNA